MNLRLGTLVLWLACSVASAQAEHWAPPSAMLNAIRQVESADGRLTVGDNGRSLGDYQISEAAWLDVNAWRKSRGLAIYGYHRYVWSSKISRTYAADYLKILHERLEKRLRRCPSPAELYAAYNMGLTSFARCQYRLANSNAVTARRSYAVQAAVEKTKP